MLLFLLYLLLSLLLLLVYNFISSYIIIVITTVVILKYLWGLISSFNQLSWSVANEWLSQYRVSKEDFQTWVSAVGQSNPG